MTVSEDLPFLQAFVEHLVCVFVPVEVYFDWHFLPDPDAGQLHAHDRSGWPSLRTVSFKSDSGRGVGATEQLTTDAVPLLGEIVHPFVCRFHILVILMFGKNVRAASCPYSVGL